jgi:hypothetical protein
MISILLLLSSLFSLALSSGLPFTLVTSDAGYPPRQNAYVARLHRPQVYFDLDLNQNVTLPPNSVLLYGGEFDCSPDVWCSSAADHTTWHLISGFTSFNDCEGPWVESAYPKSSYKATQGRMHTYDERTGRTYLLGGFSKEDANGFYNDVQYSDDHLVWSTAPSQQAFIPRAMGGAIAIPTPQLNHSTLYVIAGLGVHDTLLNDCWSSTDSGFTWTVLTKAAPFLPRQDAMITGYYDRSTSTPRLFVIGGMALNASSPFRQDVSRDAWTSTNGAQWTRKPDAPFSPRSRAGVVVTDDGVLIVLGGATTVSHGSWDTWVMSGEVFVSFDQAESWVNCTAEGGFSARELLSTVVDEDGHLMVLSGLEGWPSFGLSDIWKTTVSVWDTKALKQACGVKVDEKRVQAEEVKEVVQVEKRKPSLLQQLVGKKAAQML